VFRGFAQLWQACSKGQCLFTSDVTDAIHGPGWVYPATMILGSLKASDPTPPAGLISILGLVFVQLVVGGVLVALRDLHSNPPLHTSGTKMHLPFESEDHDLLEVQDLVHQYGWLQGFTSSGQQTLNGVSFKIAPGAMLGLLGPNGAGKTTTIKCITGEEAPKTGHICIRPNSQIFHGEVYIGLCPQETILNEDLTVCQNLLFFAFIRGAHGSTASSSVQHFLHSIGLKEKEYSFPSMLSGGMKRRLAVACAMIGMPSVAILDEPTTGLDTLSRRGVWSAISEIKEGGSCCLLTTHMLEEAEALCTDLVVLKGGAIAAQGSVQQIKNEWNSGYLLRVDSKPGQQQTIEQYVESLLQQNGLEWTKMSSRNGQMTYKMFNNPASVGHLFIALAQNASLHEVQHWGISQASLEDTYLRIIAEH